MNSLVQEPLFYCELLTRGMPVVFSLIVVGQLQNIDFIFIFAASTCSHAYPFDFHSEIDIN